MRLPTILQRLKGKHGRQTGGADHLRGARRQALRQGHQPVGLHPRLFSIAAPGHFAHAPAGQHHTVARPDAWIAAVDHMAREVDAPHMG